MTGRRWRVLRGSGQESCRGATCSVSCGRCAGRCFCVSAAAIRVEAQAHRGSMPARRIPLATRPPQTMIDAVAEPGQAAEASPGRSTRPTAWNPTTLATSAPARTFCETSTRSLYLSVRSWPMWSRRIRTRIAYRIGHGHSRVFMESHWQQRPLSDVGGFRTGTPTPPRGLTRHGSRAGVRGDFLGFLRWRDRLRRPTPHQAEVRTRGHRASASEVRRGEHDRIAGRIVLGNRRLWPVVVVPAVVEEVPHAANVL